MELLADEIASSVDEHARFGGVVPEVASRAHLQAMVPAVHRALATAGVRPRDVDAVAVTAGPGLAGALLVGVAAAKAYAAAWDVPLYGVNHLAAHVAVDTLQHGPLPPCLALLVSGGHSSLLDVPDLAGPVTPLGATIDDAAGEAFDKVARLLGLPFPGGPHIDRVGRDGDPAAIAFPRGLTGPRDAPFDFSFSGLKTAVARHVEALQRAGEPVPVADVAASFQEAVVDVLTAKAVPRGARAGDGDAACSAAGSRPTPGCARWPRSAATPPASRCGCPGPGCAPTTARWWPRWARTCWRAARSRRRWTCRPTRRLPGHRGARAADPHRSDEPARAPLTCESSRTLVVGQRAGPAPAAGRASCSVVRALAIGATTVGCAASHAERHRRDRHLVPAPAISSSTARHRARRGRRGRRGPPSARRAVDVGRPSRYLPVRKPFASP